VLRWAEKQGLIAKAPHIERPAAPRPREQHLTRDQVRALIQACDLPHLKLFVHLAYATAGRAGALLRLTWDRCDFERGKIDLEDPAIDHPHKGRAIVPMTDALRGALTEARRGALTEFVIEWAGKPVASVKRGIKAAGLRAKIGKATPHMLRHSAAVRMAEDGVPMEEIAQYLGHTNVNVTRRIYARFSADYLRNAARALELDDLGPLRPKGHFAKRRQRIDFMVVDAAPSNRSLSVHFGEGCDRACGRRCRRGGYLSDRLKIMAGQIRQIRPIRPKKRGPRESREGSGRM
jgi:integrase